MQHTQHSRTAYVGWDVGGWNCDANRESRDALVILGPDLRIQGVPWRGNLRQSINEAESSGEWTEAIWRLCAIPTPAADTSVVMAIDTPLGFSREFLNLLLGRSFVPRHESSDSSPYLYRHTETPSLPAGSAAFIGPQGHDRQPSGKGHAYAEEIRAPQHRVRRVERWWHGDGDRDLTVRGVPQLANDRSSARLTACAPARCAPRGGLDLAAQGRTPCLI